MHLTGQKEISPSAPPKKHSNLFLECADAHCGQMVFMETAITKARAASLYVLTAKARSSMCAGGLASALLCL